MTFEILDKSEQKDERELRLVPAAELHADALLDEEDPAVDTPAESDDYALAATEKSNMNINDDPTNQRLTMAEIEALKGDKGNTKDLIAKIMQSHSTLDQKTAFSLAKYTLRKHKKYMKRFTVLPLDVPMLTDWMMIQRDFSKILEIRNETIGLMGCWANIHHSGNLPDLDPSGRYLVIDDTGGLVVAAMAERMGILHQCDRISAHTYTESDDLTEQPPQAGTQKSKTQDQLATSNTLTLIHPNQQPNLSLLRYFAFDHNNPTPTHPLSSHLRTLSWLQLNSPGHDTAYTEPTVILPDVLSTLKSNRRSNYFRKRRRWERIRTIIDETRAGGFNGLVVASHTSPLSILRNTVHLLAGGAQVVIYSPHVEPLLPAVDAYSTARRTAWINTPEEQKVIGGERFPVDPTLLLSPTIHTSRARKWQVLPGRTHPLMTSRGVAEGYVFVATRVLPIKGKVEARGRPGRRKKDTKAGNTDKVNGQADGGRQDEKSLSQADREDISTSPHVSGYARLGTVEGAEKLNIIQRAEALQRDGPRSSVAEQAGDIMSAGMKRRAEDEGDEQVKLKRFRLAREDLGEADREDVNDQGMEAGLDKVGAVEGEEKAKVLQRAHSVEDEGRQETVAEQASQIIAGGTKRKSEDEGSGVEKRVKFGAEDGGVDLLARLEEQVKSEATKDVEMS